MKYSITIEWETKAELGDKIYVFPEYQDELSIGTIEKYCKYEEKIITAITPCLLNRLHWNWALRFEFATKWWDAFYSDNILNDFTESHFNRCYYRMEDAEKEREQRIISLKKRIEELIK